MEKRRIFAAVSYNGENYEALTVNIPHTRAWKWRKRMKAMEETQGSITFTRK